MFAKSVKIILDVVINKHTILRDKKKKNEGSIFCVDDRIFGSSTLKSIKQNGKRSG